MRLIIESEPHSGAWNMALDEALLESAVRGGAGAVRIYRWAEPTVSLGYFQKPAEIADDSPFAPLAKVRRLSGGGAILHHREWTYSCCLPAGHSAIRSPAALYETAHRAIIAVLQKCGVQSHLRGEAAGRAAATATADRRDSTVPAKPPEAFLCFSRGDPRDIVLNGRKIVGSAQRRRKGAVLQHGSVMLQASEFAPQLPGVAELVPGFDPPESLGEELGTAIALQLSGSLRTAEPTVAERRRAAELERDRYRRLELQGASSR